MKKSIVLLAMCLFFGSGAFAFDNFTADANLHDYWAVTGKHHEKVYNVAAKLIEGNKLDKRVPLAVIVRPNTINATSNSFYKNITVYSGILYSVDNDDELAFIISHEMAHSVEAYGGPLKLAAMYFNAKSYESKSDLKAIDYMVKAGYDPMAAIVIGNKLFDEPLWDWGFLSTHPKGSKRLLAMYKHIYKKYPAFINSPKTNSPYYKNFEYTFAEELKGFRHKESVRQQKQLQRGAI